MQRGGRRRFSGHCQLMSVEEDGKQGLRDRRLEADVAAAGRRCCDGEEDAAGTFCGRRGGGCCDPLAAVAKDDPLPPPPLLPPASLLRRGRLLSSSWIGAEFSSILLQLASVSANSWWIYLGISSCATFSAVFFFFLAWKKVDMKVITNGTRTNGLIF